jgi:hypothetical protein
MYLGRLEEYIQGERDQLDPGYEGDSKQLRESKETGSLQNQGKSRSVSKG